MGHRYVINVREENVPNKPRRIFSRLSTNVVEKFVEYGNLWSMRGTRWSWQCRTQQHVQQKLAHTLPTVLNCFERREVNNSEWLFVQFRVMSLNLVLFLSIPTLDHTMARKYIYFLASPPSRPWNRSYSTCTSVSVVLWVSFSSLITIEPHSRSIIERKLTRTAVPGSCCGAWLG